MSLSKPTTQYRIHYNASQYLWTGRYEGTKAPAYKNESDANRICIDIGIKNRNVSNRTVDVYWEFGICGDGTLPGNLSHWYKLFRCGYQIGQDAHATENGDLKFFLCSIDYDKLTHSSTYDGSTVTVYRIVACGTYTMSCDENGKFIIPIFGTLEIGGVNDTNNRTELALYNVELPDDINMPQVYVYNGSSWVAGTPYVYNGSTWQSGTIKAYNGSTWVPS